MLQCLLYCSFDIEPRIFMSNSLEKGDPYDCAKYRTISERYEEVDKWIFYYWICKLKTFKIAVVSNLVLLGVSQSYLRIHSSCHSNSDIVEIEINFFIVFQKPKAAEDEMSGNWLYDFCFAFLWSKTTWTLQIVVQLVIWNFYFSAPWYHSRMVLYLARTYGSQFLNELEMNIIGLMPNV